MSRKYPTPPQSGGTVYLNFNTATQAYAWTAGAGGGVSDHDDLGAASLIWTASAHTGTANRIAAFNGSGAASYLQVGVDVQAYDADLDTIAGLSKADGNFLVADGASWTVESGATARTSLGLGSLATQSTISNADWSGTDLAVINGGTGASDATTARSNLGLGTIATQSAASVSITGGSITGITDLAIADGGTGASTATAALDNLGVRRVTTTSDQTLIGTSYTDVTGLSFSVVSGKTYVFDFLIIADADATTTGIDVSCNGPTATVLNYTAEYWSTATATAVRGSDTYNFNTASAGSAGTARRIYRVTGILRPSADGTLSARIKREAAGSGPNVRSGSCGICYTMD
jgi:hypothetical protein